MVSTRMTQIKINHTGAIIQSEMIKTQRIYGLVFSLKKLSLPVVSFII